MVDEGRAVGADGLALETQIAGAGDRDGPGVRGPALASGGAEVA